MMDKLISLFGDEEQPANTPPVRETVNHFASDDYHIGTETVRKGDATPHTVRAGFEVAGNHYAEGDSVAGVLRSYDGSVTIEANIRDHVADTGEIPVDEWTGNKSPDHVLHAIAIVPGEFVEGAASDQYLAVPVWEDEAV